MTQSDATRAAVKAARKRLARELRCWVRGCVRGCLTETGSIRDRRGLGRSKG